MKRKPTRKQLENFLGEQQELLEKYDKFAEEAMRHLTTGKLIIRSLQYLLVIIVIAFVLLVYYKFY